MGIIDGNHILYHFLEKDLRESDVWLFQMLAARLFTSLGIWFSPTTYQSCPVLIPFAIRDPTCRRRKTGEIEEWGAPTSVGYFRDDNSLVKGLPRSLLVSAPSNPTYDGRRLGNGFVAAHVWRQLSNSTLSSRQADTNTFVPNLVWLPNQVAKLTDRDGSFAQTYLQALAVKIYRGVNLSPELKTFVDQVWEKFPMPVGIPPTGLPDVNRLAFFADTPQFLVRRRVVVAEVVAAFRKIVEGSDPPTKVVSTRYTLGLQKLDREELIATLNVLSEYSLLIGSDPNSL